jgi:hypothetical protein
MEDFLAEYAAQHLLQSAEDLMKRNSGARKYDDLSGDDSVVWVDISSELHDVLECRPDDLSEVTKARIERWFKWTESLKNPVDKMILQSEVEAVFKRFDEMTGEDWREYYRAMTVVDEEDED